jgi:beta-glucanase (GH16 family)
MMTDNEQRMKKIPLTAALCALWALAGCLSTKSNQSGQYERLVWSEEFNYTGLPDTSKWGYDMGNGCPNLCGWGNNELQYYTNSAKNARVENGQLTIEVHQETIGDNPYSSARMVSKMKGDWQYGRLEVRAQLAKGIGTWSAIWMLPTDKTHGGWPRSGEIDILENVGFMPDSALSTIHTNRYNGMHGTQKTDGINCKTLSSAYHVYGVEWTPEQIVFLFDGKPYHTYRNSGEGVDVWPFDQRFHLLLNVAVGGNWGGQKGVDKNIWPQKMLVDYVRVYQRLPG